MQTERIDWDALAKTMCFESEKDMLTTLYERNSIFEIARILNCGTATVHKRLSAFGIKKRQRGGAQNAGEQKYKLFHVDQRIIMFLGLTYAAKYLATSNSTLYKYKRYKSGGSNKSYDANVNVINMEKV